MPLTGGGALDITVGEYFTPNGQNLGAGGVKEGKGITPNVYVYDNPNAPGTHALKVAESTVAAEIQLSPRRARGLVGAWSSAAASSSSPSRSSAPVRGWR